MNGSSEPKRRIDFARVNETALVNAWAVVSSLLPRGRRFGNEWVVLNPWRDDSRLGSFKVNTITGRWADFATGDKGGDLVSLAAFVGRVSQREAAIRLAKALGVVPYA